MKKFLAILGVFAVLALSGCSAPKDEVVATLGKCKTEKFYENGDTQNYVEYGEYKFDEIDFTDNEKFEKISPISVKGFLGHMDDFAKKVETVKKEAAKSDFAKNYDFEMSMISGGDYLFIYDDPDCEKFENYNVYYFDIETLTLYYFHSNI